MDISNRGHPVYPNAPLYMVLRPFERSLVRLIREFYGSTGVVPDNLTCSFSGGMLGAGGRTFYRGIAMVYLGEFALSHQNLDEEEYFAQRHYRDYKRSLEKAAAALLNECFYSTKFLVSSVAIDTPRRPDDVISVRLFGDLQTDFTSRP